MIVTQARGQVLSTHTEVWAHSIRTHLTHIQLTERSLFLIHSHVTCHTAYCCPSETLPSHNAFASDRICCAYCLDMGWILSSHIYGDPSLTGQVKLNKVLRSGLPCRHHSSHLSMAVQITGKCVLPHTNWTVINTCIICVYQARLIHPYHHWLLGIS